MGTTQRGATLEGEPLLCAAGAGIDAIISQTPYSYASPDLRPRYLALHASVFVGFFTLSPHGCLLNLWIRNIGGNVPYERERAFVSRSAAPSPRA